VEAAKAKTAKRETKEKNCIVILERGGLRALVKNYIFRTSLFYTFHGEVDGIIESARSQGQQSWRSYRRYYTPYGVPKTCMYMRSGTE